MRMPDPFDALPTSRPRDIRHLVVCAHPIRSHQSAVYLVARALVAWEYSEGDKARIVLITSRSGSLPPLPFDIPVDILPVFMASGPGRPSRIDRAVFSCIFSSVRADTVFHIHDSRHPILLPIVQSMRALGIAYYPRSRAGSAAP
jgi:hypothetical protein